MLNSIRFFIIHKSHTFIPLNLKYYEKVILFSFCLRFGSVGNG